MPIILAVAVFGLFALTSPPMWAVALLVGGVVIVGAAAVVGGMRKGCA